MVQVLADINHISAATTPHLFNIPVEYFLFGFTLLCVAFVHKHTMKIAICGLAVVILFKVVFTEFDIFHHILGSKSHDGEWKTLLNLFGLLTGFSLLAHHFEDSGLPQRIPHYLPKNWLGGFLFLLIIAFISSFLDNIAAAMIGGSIAYILFNGKVHLGFIAAIVAASNAGGAGSVVGDTTTTMMWINGVAASEVITAYIGSAIALLTFGIIASVQQSRLQNIVETKRALHAVDHRKLILVAFILLGAISTNIFFGFPALGVWFTILVGSIVVKTNWNSLYPAVKGSIFLLSLVLISSMMPVNELPPASWHSTLGLGFISSVFDNIPLTKLALSQGGYDWGLTAFAVGFGGSMIWFGSSAGVAISSIYPDAKSVTNWLKSGWHIAVAYIIGFLTMLILNGWNP